MYSYKIDLNEGIDVAENNNSKEFIWFFTIAFLIMGLSFKILSVMVVIIWWCCVLILVILVLPLLKMFVIVVSFIELANLTQFIC